MIDRMRGLSEAVEYWSLKAHSRKGIAEVEFVRPGGGRITLTIPLNQLGELKRDLDREVPNAESRRKKENLKALTFSILIAAHADLLAGAIDGSGATQEGKAVAIYFTRNRFGCRMLVRCELSIPQFRSELPQDLRFFYWRRGDKLSGKLLTGSF
jgi:hypothetical protein